jgi:hypothetical protein
LTRISKDVRYHLKIPKFPEFHAFSNIAPGIEHLAFSTGKMRNTKTSTSLGQEASQPGSLTEAHWPQKVEAGSSPFRNPAA